MDNVLAVIIIIVAVGVLALRLYRTLRKPSDCGCAGCGCPSKSVSEACNQNGPFEDCPDKNERPS